MKKMLLVVLISIISAVTFTGCTTAIEEANLPEGSIIVEKQFMAPHKFSLLTEEGEQKIDDCEASLLSPVQCKNEDASVSVSYTTSSKNTFRNVVIERSGKKVDYDCSHNTVSEATCIPRL